jgi:MFS family permease
MLWLLLGHVRRHATFVADIAKAHDDTTSGAAKQRHWTRREVLRDPRFYVAIPAIVAPSFITTGIFFHQLHIVDEMGWSRAWFASTYFAYGGVTIAASLIFGPLIDRFGAARLLPFNLLPLGLAMLLFALSNDPLVAIGFMVASGITTGGTFTILAALWAEVYGTRHLGAVRAFAASLSVYSTAASPVILGWMIDGGTTIPTISVACLAYIVIATALVRFAYRDVAVIGRQTPA